MEIAIEEGYLSTCIIQPNVLPEDNIFEWDCSKILADYVNTYIPGFKISYSGQRILQIENNQIIISDNDIFVNVIHITLNPLFVGYPSNI